MNSEIFHIECDQCGAKADPSWGREVCPNHAHPDRSCDGRLRKIDLNPHRIRRGPYIHYKGGVYWVEGLARHDDGTLLVVYRSPQGDEEDILRTRTLSQFTEQVETTAYSGRRFIRGWNP